jgi:hypothetical protein
VLTSNGTTWQSTTTGPFLPAFGAIGSYCFVAVNVNGSTSYPNSGDTYAAGTGTNQVQSAFTTNNGGYYNYVLTDNLTGTWRWMSGSNGSNSNTYMFGLAQRIS